MATTSTSTPDTSRMVYGADDALFGSIETRQGDLPWGRVLDAGTGIHSLRWLATLGTLERSTTMTHCVAVTADAAMQRNCQREVDAMGVADKFSIVRGNWFPQADDDPAATDLPADDVAEGSFDVILADYLIGAMDGFSPYTQDLMIAKLCRYLRPGTGRLYLVGLQPLPDSVPGDADATIICRIRQVRDACILLAGHRCYREYPLSWIERQIQQQQQQQQEQNGSPQLRLVHSSRFPILYTAATAVKQINVGRSKLPLIRAAAGGGNPTLADGLERELQSLEEQIRAACAKRPNGKIELGFDYVVTAELV
eukprot:scaffold9074_cov141-Amphora_coffeaeformis.AAC.3